MEIDKFYFLARAKKGENQVLGYFMSHKSWLIIYKRQNLKQHARFYCIV